MRAPRRSRASQRGIFTGLFRSDGSHGGPADARTGDHVRAWHAFVQLRSQADRLGQAGTPFPRTSVRHSRAILQLWNFQSYAGVQITRTIEDEVYFEVAALLLLHVLLRLFFELIHVCSG